MFFHGMASLPYIGWISAIHYSHVGFLGGYGFIGVGILKNIKATMLLYCQIF